MAVVQPWKQRAEGTYVRFVSLSRQLNNVSVFLANGKRASLGVVGDQQTKAPVTPQRSHEINGVAAASLESLPSLASPEVIAHVEEIKVFFLGKSSVA